ncbi:MAG: hypothetical protein HC836_15545 [Richelia sp. RM2_1_2]|nr:hypothetical protein [Richelia sp. RM2_1_2]
MFEHVEGSDIFNEIIDINQVWFSDEWGTRYGFKVSNYRKRIDFDNQYEVIKFNATDIVKA